MNKKLPTIGFEEISDITTLVNYHFSTYGEIYILDGEAVFDIKTICLTITDMEAILLKMKEKESKK